MKEAKPMFKLIINAFADRKSMLMSVLQLFLWPLEETADIEVDGETLDEALTRINANMNSLPQLTNFPPGNISLSLPLFPGTDVLFFLFVFKLVPITL